VHLDVGDDINLNIFTHQIIRLQFNLSVAYVNVVGISIITTNSSTTSPREL